MTVLTLLAAAGCTPSHGERLARVDLDCPHRDKDVCLMANAIRDQLLEALNRRPRVGQPEQVERDVGAIMNGMQRSGAGANVRARDVVTDPMASGATPASARSGCA